MEDGHWIGYLGHRNMAFGLNQEEFSNNNIDIM